MNPEWMQQMQEMRRQRMEMMQANRRAMPMMGPGGASEPESMRAQPDSQAPAAAADQDLACAEMHGRHGKGGMHMKGMKKEMMAMKQQHMQAVEQRLSNIENLMREAVELLKNR